MKIVLEIPDFPGAERRALFVFAGITPIAEKLPGKPWKIKTGHCSQCGKCCSKFNQELVFPPVINKVCLLLEEKGKVKRCSLGVNRPMGCAVTHPSIEGCTVKYEEVD